MTKKSGDILTIAEHAEDPGIPQPMSCRPFWRGQIHCGKVNPPQRFCKREAR